MIFVTVGTHEQQFDRLVEAVDNLKRDGVIREDVFIQTGYSTYVPQHCGWERLLPYQEMTRRVAEARIIITHGGPSSFIAALQIGKIPIVVPRQRQFGEHVNDHQVEFCRAVKERMGNIILVENVDTLEDAIGGYEDCCRELGYIYQTEGSSESGKGNSAAGKSAEGRTGNNRRFNERLEEIVRELGV